MKLCGTEICREGMKMKYVHLGPVEWVELKHLKQVVEDSRMSEKVRA